MHDDKIKTVYAVESVYNIIVNKSHFFQYNSRLMHLFSAVVAVA